MNQPVDEPFAALREALASLASRQHEMTVEMTSLADSIRRHAHGEIGQLERLVRAESTRTRRELSAGIDSMTAAAGVRLDLFARRLTAGLVAGQLIVAVVLAVALLVGPG